MPKFGVTLPNGREILIEGDRPPDRSELDAIWKAVRTPADVDAERQRIAADVEARQPVESETWAKAQMAGAAGMAQAAADPITGAARIIGEIPGMRGTPTAVAAAAAARLVRPLSEAGQAAEEAAAGMQGNEAVAAAANAIGSGVGSAPYAMIPGIGPGVSAGSAGLQSFESTRRDAVKTLAEAGMPLEEAERTGMKIALGAGVITAGVTGAFNEFGGRFGLGKGVERGLSSQIQQVTINELRKSAFGETLKKVAKEALGEASEEAVDQALQEGFIRWQYDKSQTLADSVKQVAKAFALGGVAGGVIGGPGAAAEVVGNRLEASRAVSRGDFRPREAGAGAPPPLSGVPGDTAALPTPVDIPAAAGGQQAKPAGTYVYGTTADGKQFVAEQPAGADPAAAKDYIERAIPGARISRVEIVSTPEEVKNPPSLPAQPQTQDQNGQVETQGRSEDENGVLTPENQGPPAEPARESGGTESGAPEVPAATGGPEVPAELPRKPRRIARTPIGDILDDIEQAGGLISKSQAKKLGLLENLGPEYDDAGPLAHPSHGFVYGNGSGGKGKLTPDKALQAIQASNPGRYGDMTIPEMWAAIQAASRGRVADAGRRQAEIRAAKTDADFAKSTSPGKGKLEVLPGDLGVGETLTVDGEKVRVTGYDPGTGDVILDDGQRFGRQRVAPDSVLYVEKITPAGGSTRTSGQQAAPETPFSLGPQAGGDLFGAPESVEEQKARVAREKAAAKAKADREEMLRRHAAPLTGRAVDTTSDMFDARESDTPLFAQKPKPQQPRNGELFSQAPAREGFTPLGVDRAKAELGRLFGGKVPNRIRVEPGQPTSNGARIEAYLANDGSIVIHGDNIQTPADVRRVVRHEALHDVFDDPEVRAPWNRMMAAMDRPAREKQTRGEGYTSNVLEESTIDETETRVDAKQPLFRRFVNGIAAALARRGHADLATALFGLNRMADVDARALVGYATRLDRMDAGSAPSPSSEKFSLANANELNDRRRREGDQRQLEIDFSKAVESLGTNPISPAPGATPVQQGQSGGVAGSGVKPVFSETASRIRKDLKERKVVNPVGLSAKTEADRHAIAALFRNPRFEVFRWFLLKDGKVVAVASITAKSPDTTFLSAAGADFDQVMALAEQVGADSYFITHNHPSGESSPSPADYSGTRALLNGIHDDRTGGLSDATFLGHIITNHERHHVIGVGGSVNAVDLDPGEDEILGKKLWPGQIISPRELALAATAISGTKKGFSIIFVDARRGVRSVGEIDPTALFDDVVKALRDHAVATGSTGAFGYLWENDPSQIELAERLVKSGLLDDAFTPKSATSVATYMTDRRMSVPLHKQKRSSDAVGQISSDKADAMRFSLAQIREDQDLQETAGRVATPVLTQLAHAGASVQAEMGAAGNSFSAWREEMLRRHGPEVLPLLGKAWDHVRSLRYSLENGMPPETVADIADITAEANATPSAIDPKQPTPVYNSEMVAKWWHKLVRPSDVISRFGGEDMIRKRNLIDLRTAWQAAEVRKQSEALSRQLENSFYGDNAGPILRFVRQFAPREKLRRFMRHALPIAARINVTGGEPGAFTFSDFQQRAGFLPESQAAKRGVETGQAISWADPITGKFEVLKVGDKITLEDGRKGYQLLRDMPSDRQQRLYEWAQQEFPEFAWFLNTWVDPRLADTRIKVNGVDLPVFNRLALAGRYAEGDPGFTPRPAYTPDVGVGVGLLRKFLTQRKVTFREGITSPGRFYETGEAREQGRTLDLLSGFNVRAMQVMQEQVRQEWARHVLGKAEPIPPEGLPVGWTRVETAMQDIVDADRRMRAAHPLDFPQLDPDKPAPPVSADLERLFGKLAKREGPPLMIPQPLVDALTDDMATVQNFGVLGDLARLWAKNWKAFLLLMPTTFTANRTDNYLRMLIEAHRQLWLAAIRGGDREALTAARKLAYASIVNVIPGIRPILGLNDEALFREVRERVLPPEVFGDSTRMRDLWVEKGDVTQEIESAAAQGQRGRAIGKAAANIGPLILEKTGYGNIDVRAKQQFAFTMLLAKAEHAAWSRGLRGEVKKGFIREFMLNPPEIAVADAVDQAGKNLLRYGDSPGWLGKLARIPALNTFVAFPMFRYHFVGREIDRATKALRLFHKGFVRGKKLTRDQWAEALADTISYVMLPVMGYAAAKVAGALTDSLVGAAAGGDDDDDPRRFVGASSRFDVDDDGNTVRKPLPRELVTANRLNISAMLRQLGIETGSDEDYWWAMKDYPIVRSAALFYLAAEDTRKRGARAGIVTLGNGLKDLMMPLMGTGQAVKVPAKIAAELEGAEAGRPAFTSVDPYATNVPLDAYLTLQALNLIPGQRQANEIIKWLDPVPRRVTRSKSLGYDPGVVEALRSEGWTGLADRAARGLFTGDPSSPLPPQGTIDKRLGVVTEPRQFSLQERIAALMGQNLKSIPREEYQRAVEE